MCQAVPGSCAVCRGQGWRDKSKGASCGAEAGGGTLHPTGPPQGDLVAEPGPGTPPRARRSAAAVCAALQRRCRAEPARSRCPPGPPIPAWSYRPKNRGSATSPGRTRRAARLSRLRGEWWVDERVGREGDDFGCWLAIFTSLFSRSSHSSVLFSLAWELGHRGEDGDGF